jgi:hypothetical protein
VPADNEGYHARVVERRQQRRRPVRVTSTTAEDTDSSDVNDERGERWSRESGRDSESFRMKSETARNRLLFIGSKISSAVLNQSCC